MRLSIYKMLVSHNKRLICAANSAHKGILGDPPGRPYDNSHHDTRNDRMQGNNSTRQALPLLIQEGVGGW